MCCRFGLHLSPHNQKSPQWHWWGWAQLMLMAMVVMPL